MLSGLTLAAQGALGARRTDGQGPPQEHARSLAVGFLAGLVGHRVDLHGDWVPAMSFRHQARDVGADELLAILGDRRGSGRPIDVAVLVHGLFVDEQNWLLGSDPLAAVLEPMFGWTPLLVRYNTGRHISHSGTDLADLLDGLHDAWGSRLGRIQVVGHSMGGLVSRAALGALQRRGSAVLEHIDRLFLLATPNHGAELERLGHAIEVALSRAMRLPSRGLDLLGPRKPVDSGGLVADTFREVIDGVLERAGATASLPIRSARALVGLRSDGIRDVRYGYMQESEWRLDKQFSERLLINHRRPLPPPPNVTTYAVAGSLLPTVGAEPSRFRNDGLVSVASAAGFGGDFDDLGVVDSGRFAEIPLLVHQLLPSSERVRAKLREWVAADGPTRDG